MEKKAAFYSGTSGLVLPVPNKTHYPEAYKNKSRLSYYAALTNSIEVNSSFYKIPQRKTVEKWAGEVSDHFKFTFKLFRDITHNKGLIYSQADISQFFTVIDGAGHKKGALLIQLPGSIRVAQLQQIICLLNDVRLADPDRNWDTVLEVRHPSLYIDPMFQLLAHLQIGMVLQDKKEAATPWQELNQDFVYLRFHGPEGDYRGTYDDAFLAEYASYISQWRAEGKRVYAYFNNTMGHAFENLNSLKTFVSDDL